ncbi:hypothetical protein CGRA01v4_14279 [Colletotrichum graminicola]|uniref:Uncharacterized protein n=1 Tax=Colletotrichum graminicola (strain M1.001 / M2 / FGSC 10212) TaxID=645133 RepID=E3Q5A7_COLGM|nr:uncharacterized protein GLRG_01018 [Colletotrichum graminicola M1.001]EFQ25874.1 hypothetical protein GLRG_01018 [Colletotrichum graminicola M1.001]WDK22988.1 hypothetical protein CGRA01v4_14279 [Colletotrichum graminicola]
MSDSEKEDLAVYSGTASCQARCGPREDLLVHGIRHVQGFATSSEVTRVCSGVDLYARARNARLIMSNTIPDMASPAEKPYCIWYPDVATEDTYRGIARRYPDMRYQNPRPGACLNGDTAVRSSLQRHASAEEIEATSEEEFSLRHWPEHYFDIQEDSNAGSYKWPFPGCAVLRGRDIDLLHQPLPRDLPPVNKDILILMAAWDGNIDRYARLRCPVTLPNEISAVVRGAYHHTPFARWLETSIDDAFPCQYESDLIWQAIHARFIMNDDVSRIDRELRGKRLPELFWWPHCPHEYTLRELAWRRPDLEHQVTLACIAGNYRDLFLELSKGAKPTQQQREAAILSPNEFYRKHLERGAKEEGVNLRQHIGFNLPSGKPWPWESAWSKDYLRPNKELYRGYYALSLPAKLTNRPDDHDEDWDEEYYPPEDNLLNYHMHLQLGAWQRLISATATMRQEAEAKGGISLYSTAEDEKRRAGPRPQPKYPKNDSDKVMDDSTRAFLKEFERKLGSP